MAQVSVWLRRHLLIDVVGNSVSGSNPYQLILNLRSSWVLDFIFRLKYQMLTRRSPMIPLNTTLTSINSTSNAQM